MVKNCVKSKRQQNVTLKISETPADTGVVKVAKFFNSIVYKGLDKGSGFSVMKRQMYHKKLAEVLDWSKARDLVL